ncbi:MAG: hypothetical protein R3C39_05195 [Dehalococcoidia bacterium]
MPTPTLNATTATPFAGVLATPDPNRRGPQPTRTVVVTPPASTPSLTLAGPSGSTNEVQDTVDEVTPTPTPVPSGPRALASSDTPLQQALVVAGAPNDRNGGGGTTSGGTGSDASSVEGGSSSMFGGLDSNLVLMLSLLAALGIPAAAIGGRIYQIRRE